MPSVCPPRSQNREKNATQAKTEMSCTARAGNMGSLTEASLPYTSSATALRVNTKATTRKPSYRIAARRRKREGEVLGVMPRSLTSPPATLRCGLKCAVSCRWQQSDRARRTLLFQRQVVGGWWRCVSRCAIFLFEHIGTFGRQFNT